MKDEPEEKPKKTKEEEIWNVGEVTTETEPRVANAKTNEALTTEQALALILNKLEKIEKNF